MKVRVLKLAGIVAAVAALHTAAPLLASAQIISQTPRPSLPPTETVSTVEIQPDARIGRSGEAIKVPRTGALAFAAFDSNADYIITMDEVRSGIDRSFAAADKDGSGALSLVELEAWRTAALGSLGAAPNNFAFAPNFARSVSREKFREVLMRIAGQLDADKDGNTDGQIAFADLLKTFVPPRAGIREEESCAAQISEVRRRAEQQCRNNRGY